MFKYSFIFLLVLLASCGARKVDVQKTETVVKVDSTSVTKKEESTTTQNNISINTDIDECEIVPLDNTKPVIIGDKKYYNAKIKYKKTKVALVDTTKKENFKKESQEVKLVKDKKEKAFKKNVDKKESYSIYWWWLLIILLFASYFYFRKKLKEMLL
jgi:hypothetical protein